MSNRKRGVSTPSRNGRQRNNNFAKSVAQTIKRKRRLQRDVQSLREQVVSAVECADHDVLHSRELVLVGVRCEPDPPPLIVRGRSRTDAMAMAADWTVRVWSDQFDHSIIATDFIASDGDPVGGYATLLLWVVTERLVSSAEREALAGRWSENLRVAAVVNGVLEAGHWGVLVGEA